MKVFLKAVATLAATIVLAAGNLRTLSASAAAYTQTVDVVSSGSALNIEPTLILEADSFGKMQEIEQATVRPASVIVTPDADMNVSLGGESKTLAETFDGYMKGRFIPVVRLTAETVDTFAAWMKNTYTVSDIMAVSSEIEVIEKLYADEVCYIVNTVYDLTSVSIPENRYELWQYVGEANAAGCNILMFDGADGRISLAAEYVSSLTKVCWAYADDKTEAVAAMAAGCYGVAAQSADALTKAAAIFSKDGFARAQYLAAHRGVTAYANENSLTALAAAANEGATHVEIDLQITSDGQLLICHESDAGARSTAPGGTWFAVNSSAKLRGYTLDDYSERYGETFPLLSEVVKLMKNTDVILILELKLDNGSAAAVSGLKAIEKLKAVMDEYPEMAGRWFAITFFAPYAEEMRRVCPEIPVGFLGYAKADNGTAWSSQPAMTAIGKKIAFLRKYNMTLDEELSAATYTTARNYLARGYTQNTWTFKDTSHFSGGANIATTDKAEEGAMLVRQVCPSGELKATSAQLASGKIQAQCKTYNGWNVEKECEIIPVAEVSPTEIKAVLYYRQDASSPYGIYSNLITLNIA